MSATKFFLFLGVVAFSSARVVRRLGADDIMYNIPEQKDVKIGSLVINSQNNKLILHGPDITLDAGAGVATGHFTDVDLEIGHYTLKGKYDVVDITGDGTISLKQHPVITVKYTPESATNSCPKAGTKMGDYTIAMEKLECQITNLYADNIKIDMIADTFLESNAKKVGEQVQKILNGAEAHDAIDSAVFDLLTKFCQ